MKYAEERSAWLVKALRTAALDLIYLKHVSGCRRANPFLIAHYSKLMIIICDIYRGFIINK